jgi:catechol 2,3-dioxygenase-like lactoylglutathione lyase family enzyme
MKSPAVESIDHLVITVREVSASAAWYQRVLGMGCETFCPPGSAKPRVALRFGIQKIHLRPVQATQAEWFTGQAGAPGTQDLCFLTTAAPDEIMEHLHRCEVRVELGPVAKAGARGELQSVYCRDPDGNLIEISSYRD